MKLMMCLVVCLLVAVTLTSGIARGRHVTLMNARRRHATLISGIARRRHRVGHDSYGRDPHGGHRRADSYRHDTYGRDRTEFWDDSSDDSDEWR